MTEVSLRRRGDGRVSNVELFFDLVYVFAVTQLSHVLDQHADFAGAWQAAVLLAMVWQVWVYTTWSVNYLDPSRGTVRVMLLVLMLGSLVLAAELPEAFHDRAWPVAGAYVAMQVGRCLFTVWALHGEALQRTFLRILPWSSATGAIVLAGAAVPDVHLREALWAVSVVIDLAAAAVGFYVPGLGGSRTADWTISGSHFAERCQAFVLIALGESIVVIGSTLYGFGSSPDSAQLVAFACTFVSSVALWWIYFDRSAEDSAEHISRSPDPGRLARDAFHWVHPVIVAGIIVAAAADTRLLDEPHAHGDMTTACLILGGAALYLAGHAIFKAVVWRLVSWQRVGGVAVLLALLVLAPHVSSLTIAFCSLAVVVVVAVVDRVRLGPLDTEEAAPAAGEPT